MTRDNPQLRPIRKSAKLLSKLDSIGVSDRIAFQVDCPYGLIQFRGKNPFYMSFTITHRYGGMDRNPPISTFRALLQELDVRPDDKEHGCVAVTHESEWCISVSLSGHVILEHLERGGERHMTNVSREKIIELWGRLADGDIANLDAEPWKPGYR